jgi:hypothetical protein
MREHTPDLATVLPMTTAAPALARVLTRQASGLVHKAAVADVAQVLSELVTNAVK